MYTSPDQDKYEQVLEQCEQIIDGIEQVFISYKKVLFDAEDNLFDSLKDLEEQPFTRMRSKIKAGLINIAVCGAFSSGKSFLISSLINRLGWIRKSQEEAGDFENLDEYISFLPSSPEQTSSCPLAVIPSGTSEEHSRLEILFNDTKIWEDISGLHSTEDQIASKMRAYVTNLQDSRSTRRNQDWQRYVIGARLYVPNMFLPAIIYDLPGIGGAGQQYGGAGEYYTKLVHDYLRQSDCIVYVASAIKELTDAELELLSVVEEISEKNRCPVFFVLSQIDREKSWERVREINNKFLRDYFKRDGKANLRFIGQGFMGLSPATEAKALGLYENGEMKEEQFNLKIKKSGMPVFRQVLTEHLTSVSGLVHLREITFQAHNLLKRIVVNISARIQVELVPVQEAQSRIREYEDLVDALIEKKKSIISDLDELGKQCIWAAFYSTDPDELLKELKEGLEPLIQKSDVLKKSDIHIIEQRQKEIVYTWLSRPDGGFETSWNQAQGNYQMQANRLLQRRLNEAIEEASMPADNLIGWIRHPKFDGSMDNNVIKLGETLSLVGTAWQTWIGITGISVGGLSSIFATVSGAASTLGPLTAVGSAVAALSPVSLFLVVAGTVSLGWSTMRNAKERDKQKKKIIDDYLPSYAEQIVKQLDKQAKESIGAYTGLIIKVIDDLIGTQESACTLLRKTLSSNEHRLLEDRIALLRDLENQCEVIENRIEEFYSDVAPMTASKS